MECNWRRQRSKSAFVFAFGAIKETGRRPEEIAIGLVGPAVGRFDRPKTAAFVASCAARLSACISVAHSTGLLRFNSLVNAQKCCENLNSALDIAPAARISSAWLNSTNDMSGGGEEETWQSLKFITTHLN